MKRPLQHADHASHNPLTLHAQKSQWQCFQPDTVFYLLVTVDWTKEWKLCAVPTLHFKKAQA